MAIDGPKNELLKNKDYLKAHNQILKEIEGDIKPYTIQAGDTLLKIASDENISLDSLSIINELKGNTSINPRNLKIGSIIYLPTNSENFKNKLKKIKLLSSVRAKNEKVQEEGHIVEMSDIFPSSPVSIPSSFDSEAYINAQKNEYNPDLARHVLSMYDKGVLAMKASCRHSINQHLYNSVNKADLTAKQVSYFMKGGKDAWKIPEEIISKLSYKQEKNLMASFDETKIGVKSTNPIKDSEKDNYIQSIYDLDKYLKEKGLANSLVPFLYKDSRYREKHMAPYNKDLSKANKHFDTHQALFEKYDTIQFNACDTKDYSSGETKMFGIDFASQKAKLNSNNTKLEQLNKKTILLKKELGDLTNIDKNPALLSIKNNLKKVLNRTMFDSKGSEILLTEIAELIITGKEYSSKIRGATGLNPTQEDIKHYSNIKLIYDREVVNQIELRKKVSSLSKDGTLSVSSNSKEILKKISDYNNTIISIKNTETAIVNINNQIKEAKTKKIEISALDYIANFIQDRLDQQTADMKLARRKEIFDGFKKYPNLINVSIVLPDNTKKKINILEELSKAQDQRTKITPDSKIEITGALLSDGEIQNNNDDEKRNSRMNTRSRFLFEYIISEQYYATELLVPTKDSGAFYDDGSKRKGIFDKEKGLKSETVFSLEKGETLEAGIKRIIPKIEKEAFNSLVEGSPEYNKKLNYFYSLQLKAYQMLGVLKDENHINPGGAVVNKGLYYFNSKNISGVYGEYIKNARENIRLKSNNEINDLGKLQKFIDVNILEGDTELNIFRNLVFNLKGREKELIDYKFLKNISEYYNAEASYLIKTLFTRLYDKNGNIRKGTKISVGFKQLDEALSSLHKNRTISVFKVNDLDKKLISNITEVPLKQEMLQNILFIESYKYTDAFLPRLERKRIGEILRRTLAFSPSLNHLLDFKYDSKNNKFAGDYSYNNFLVNSLGDFQLKYEEKFNSYVNEKTISEAIRLLEKKAIKDMLSLNLSNYEKVKIQADLKEVEEIKQYLGLYSANKQNPEKEREFRTKIVYKLANLTRLSDDKDSTVSKITVPTVSSVEKSNIVGKVLSGYFISKKIDTTANEIFGWMSISGFSRQDIYKSDKYKESFEKRILLSNNMGGQNFFNAVLENYICRLLGTAGVNKNSLDDIYKSNGKLRDKIGNYVNILKTSNISEENKKLLLSVLEGKSNVSNIFANKSLTRFLEVSGEETFPLPTGNELKSSRYAYMNKEAFTDRKLYATIRPPDMLAKK